MFGEIPQYAAPESGKPISTRMQKYQSAFASTSGATLTLKSRSSRLRRREFEYAIPTLDAEELISLRRSYIVEKIRHIVPYGNLNWEIDVFSGENQGLVVAEVELPDEDHEIELPPWVGPEVTGQDRYYNGTLAQHPYRSWLHHDATVAAE